MRISRTLLGSTISAALGGLLFGIDTAVISGTTDTNAIISWTFPIVAQQSAASAFAAYAAMMVLQLVWVLGWMPETKGVSLEEIQKQLRIE